MATSGELFEAAVSYYSNLAYRSLAVMRSTQQEIRTEQFDLGRFAARTMSFWFDAVGGWWSALQLNTAPTLPTVFVSVPAGLVDKRPVTVTLPGGKIPDVTPLYALNGKVTLKGTVEADPAAQRDQITLTVRPHEDAEPAIYQGYVLLEDKPLVLMVVRVTEKLPPPPGPSAS